MIQKLSPNFEFQLNDLTELVFKNDTSIFKPNSKLPCKLTNIKKCELGISQIIAYKQ